MSPVAGVTSVSNHAFLADDVPWRSTSAGMKSVPRIHNSPVLRVPQNPTSAYAIQVMKVSSSVFPFCAPSVLFWLSA